MALKLLVIEGDQGILDVIDQVIENGRHEVIITKDSGVLNNLDVIMPDIIFLDEWLHLESGMDLCRKLKSDPKTGYIPVVLLSAMVSAEQIALTVGANSFIRKPFDLHDLTEVINKFV